MLKDSGRALIGEDRLTGAASGSEYAIRFHLHPNATASLTGNGNEVLIQTKSKAGWRFICKGDVKADLDESVYIGHRGYVRTSQHIILRGTADTDEALVKWGVSQSM